MEDRDIIELYIQRSDDAVKETESKYGKYLMSVAKNILADVEDCRECVNDTYLNAWNMIPAARPASLQIYLGKITRNLALDRYDKLTAEKRGGGQYELALEELSECIADTEAAVEVSELPGLIDTFLADLGEEKRKIFVKRYFYMDPVKKIAEDLSVSESNVKTTLFRLRSDLKERLVKEGIEI